MAVKALNEGINVLCEKPLAPTAKQAAELYEAAKNGKLEEAWGTGTAAVVSPIGWLSYKDEEFVVNGGKIGPITQKLYDELTGIQWGKKEDTFGWTVTANGTVGLQGSSSVSAHNGGGSTYGVVSGAVLLASGHFSPPSDDILRLRLQCWARNVGDGKK